MKKSSKSLSRSFAIFCALLCISMPLPALAETSPGTTNSGSVNAEQINLDLSSTTRNLTPGKLTRNGDINITVGDSVRTVTSTDLLTPAERLAAYQVFSTGQQSLILSGLGNAVGGSFTMGPKFNQYVSGLVIPEGVTGIRDFGVAQALNLTGNLTNAGNIFAVSTNAQVATAAISAQNILNQSSGLISSVLPNGGLSGFSNAITNLNLNLTAINDIINHGTIRSAGNLNLQAGGAINNTGLMSAVNTIAMVSNVGSIVNSGVISSSFGNINLASLATSNMIINALAGRLDAARGAINVRDALYSGSGNIDIVGGDWISQELNLFSGTGTINADFANVSGTMSNFGNEAHVVSSAPNLVLGTIKLDGDPTYYNLGNIQITGNISVGEKLAILATGNITSTAGVSEIRARDGSGQGYDINIVAGANLSPACSTCYSSLSGAPATSGGVTVNLSGAPGGNIDFSASPNLKINANSTGTNLSGGSVTLAAFANGATGGRISLAPTSEVNTSGNGSGSNGNIKLIAGATSGTAITAGKLTASGGTGAANGNIFLSAAQPTSSNGAAVTFDSAGNITSGNSFQASSTLQPSSIVFNDNVSAANTLDVRAGGDISAVAREVTSFAVGTWPQWITTNPSGTRIYVANRGSNTVSVIDPATNSIVATIPVPNTPVGMEVTGNTLYVSNGFSNTVTYIDTTTNTVQGAIVVGDGPNDVVASPDGSKIYVAVWNVGVVIIDNASKTVVGQIPMSGLAVFGLGINPEGTRLYTANVSGNSVSVIDTSTNSIIQTIPAGTSTYQTAVDPTGQFVYAVNHQSNNVSVISTATNSVIATVPVGSGPTGVMFNPQGTLAYVSNYASNTVTTISTATHSVVQTVPVSSDPRTIGSAVVRVGNNLQAYITHFYGNSVSVVRMPSLIAPNVSLTSTSGNINVTTNANNLSASTGGTGNVLITEVDSVSLGQTSAGGTLQVGATGDISTTGTISAQHVKLNAGSDILHSADIVGGVSATLTAGGDVKSVSSIISSISVGGSPHGTVLNEAGTRAYTANASSGTISVIDTATNTVIATIGVGAWPKSVALSPDGTRLYVANLDSHNVSVINTSTNTVIATIAVGTHPQGVAINSTGTRLYVPNLSSKSISIIDTASNSVIQTVNLTVGPQSIVVNPSDTFAYFVVPSSDQVGVFDLTSNTIVTYIPVGDGPRGIVISPTGEKLYVANLNSNSISVIDTKTNSVASTMTTPYSIFMLDLNPQGTLLYGTVWVPHNKVLVIDTATNTIVEAVGPTSAGLLTGEYGSFMGAVNDHISGYVSDEWGNKVHVFRTPIISTSTLSISASNAIVATKADTLSTKLSGYGIFTEANNLTLGSATATDSLEVGANGTIATTGPIAGSNVTLRSTGPTSGISVSNTITSSGSTFLGTSRGGAVTTSTGGNIQAGSEACISAGGEITINGNISATDVSLKTTANNSSIRIGADINASASAVLQANGSGSVVAVHQLLTSIPLSTGPHEVAINAAGTYAYTANPATHSVSVIDLSNNTVVATITGLNDPAYLATNHSNSRAYVINTGNNTLSVIDTSSNSIIATVPVGSGANEVVVNAADTFAYVSNFHAGTVSVLRTSDNTVVATIPVGTWPQGIAISSDNHYVYVPTSGGGNVVVIDASTNSVVRSISVPGTPNSVAITPDNSKLYVGAHGTNSVYVVNIANGAILSQIPIGGNPQGLDINPQGTFVYAVSQIAENINVIDTATNQIVQTIPLGTQVTGHGDFVAVVGNNVTAYIPRRNLNDLAVIQLPTIAADSLTVSSLSGTVRVATAANTSNVSTTGTISITPIGVSPPPPPPPSLISSLDLLDPTAVSIILNLQGLGTVGGTLLTSGGIATGGSLIITPDDLAAEVIAQLIPTGVTLTLDDFETTPFTITLSSPTPQVTINGTQEFVGTGTFTGVYNLASTSGTPTLVVGSSGLLRSDSSLTLSVGALNNAGTIQAQNQLSIGTTGSASTGTLSAGSSINVAAASVHIANNLTAPTVNVSTFNQGSINIAGNVTAGTITLSADGSGNITHSGATASNVLSASTVNLSSGSGNIGSGAVVSSTNIYTDCNLLTVNTAGSVIVADLGHVTLGASSAGHGQSFILSTQGPAGSINLNGDVRAAGAGNVIGYIRIESNGTSSAITRSSGVLVADSVDLHSTMGSIGSGALQSASNIFTDAGTLSATISLSGGNVAITDVGSVTLATSFPSSGQTFQLATQNNGSINIAGNVTAGTIILSANGSGNITHSGATASNVLNASTVNLSSGSGNIGSGAVVSSTNIYTDCNLLTVNTTGSVIVADLGHVSLGASSAGHGQSFILSTQGPAGSINLNGDVRAAGAGNVIGYIRIESNGTSSAITRSSGVLVADSIDLVSTMGSIGSGGLQASSNIFTDAGTLAARISLPGGNVAITDVGSVSLSTSFPSSGQTFQLATQNNGSINIAGNVTAGTIILSADGSGNITHSGATASNVLTASTVNLSSGSGNIGSGATNSGGNVFTDTNLLTVNTAGSVTVADLGHVTLGASSAGHGQSFILSTQGPAGSINLNGDVRAAGAGNVIGYIRIESNGTSSAITRSSGVLVADTVDLHSTMGSIGSGALRASSNIFTDAGTLSSTISLPGGNVAITDIGSVTLAASFPSSGQTFQLATQNNGSINIAGNVTAGTIVLSADGSGNITHSGATASNVLTASTVNLSSGSGNIGSGAVVSSTNIYTDCNLLTVNTAGSVIVADLGHVTLGSSSAGHGQSFILSTQGPAGSINLNGDVRAAGAGNVIGYIRIESNGTSSAITRSSGVLVADSLDLHSTMGSIGSGALRTASNIFTDAGTLSATISLPGGNVAITDVGSVALATSFPSSGQTFQLATQNNGSINVAGNVTAGTIILSADGSGNITHSGATASNVLTASTVNLSSGSGNIGSGAVVSSTNIYTDCNLLTVNTAGSVIVADLGHVTLGSSSAGHGQSFILSTQGPAGSINLNGDVRAAGAGNVIGYIRIESNGTSSAITRSSGVLVADTVDLHSTMGSIGSGALRASSNIFTDAGTLSSTISLPGGSIAVTDIGSVTLATSFPSSGQTFQLATQNNGSINIAGNVTAGTIILSADGSGNITHSGATASNVLTASTVNLSSGSGNIGSGAVVSSTNIYTDCNLLTVNTAGSVIVADLGHVTLGASSAGHGQSFILSTQGPAGSINLNGDVRAAGAGNVIGYIRIESNGTSSAITRSSGVLVADWIDLISTMGSIGSGGLQDSSNIFTDAGTIAARISLPGGNIAITDIGSVNLDTSFPSSGHAFQLATQNSGSINIAGNVSAGSLILSASGSITQSSGIVSGDSVSLSAQGSIGSSSAPIQTDAAFLTFHTPKPGGGDVWINALAPINIGDSTADDVSATVHITGPYVIVGTIDPAVLTIAITPGSNGSIVVQGNLIASSLINLSADGTGTITQVGGTLLQAPNLVLSSGSGDIGTASELIVTSASSLSVSTSGNAFVEATGNTALDSAFNGISIYLTTVGTLTVNNPITASQSITLVGDQGVVLNAALTSPVLNMYLGNTSLGSAANPFVITSPTFSIVTGGDLYLSASQALVLGESYGHTFDLVSSAAVTVDGSVAAEQGLQITAPSLVVEQGSLLLADAGDVVINTPSLTNEDMIAAVGGSVMLNSSGSLSVTNDGVIVAVGSISATAQQGLLISGTSGELAASNAITLSSANSNVSVDQAAISGVVQGSSGSNFSVVARQSGLTVGNITAGVLSANVGITGDVTLSAGAGQLLVVPSASILAQEGNATLMNTQTDGTGSIYIDAGAQITARSTRDSARGNVFVSVGPLNYTRVGSETVIGEEQITCLGCNLNSQDQGLIVFSITYTGSDSNFNQSQLITLNQSSITADGVAQTQAAIHANARAQVAVERAPQKKKPLPIAPVAFISSDEEEQCVVDTGDDLWEEEEQLALPIPESQKVSMKP